jgi:interleukin-1 receptor-associated kinase 1
MFPEKIEPQQSGNHQQRTTNTVPADKVVIAVKAEKVISKTALAWALTHVVHPGDGITLLAVFTKEKSGNPGFSNVDTLFSLLLRTINFLFSV